MKINKFILPIAILLGCIILGGFYYTSQTRKQAPFVSQEENEIIEENNNKDEVDNFQKKVECEKYKDKIMEEINEYNSSQEPEYRNSDNTDTNLQINLYVEQKELKEIFYSPKENSCLYLLSFKTLFKIGEDAKVEVGEWNIAYDTYYLIDVLTSEEIDFNNGLSFIQVIHRGEIFNNQKDVSIIINEYK